MNVQLSKRIGEVDVLRGFAALSMLFGHAIIFYPVDISGIYWCKVLGHFIFTYHMELFFCLAGFVYRCSNYKEYLLKKAKHIMLPYVLFNIVTIFLKAYGGNTINGTETLSTGFLKMLTGGNYWFLYDLFIFFILYPFIERLCNSMTKKITMSCIVIIVSAIIKLPIRMLWFFPFFVFGNVFRAAFDNGHIKLHQKKELWKSILFIIAAMSLFIFITSLEKYDIFTERNLPVLVKYLQSGLVLVSIASSFHIISPLWAKGKSLNLLHGLFVSCSKYSLQMYLFNGFFLTLSRILICNVLGIENAFIISFGIFIINVSFILLACIFIVKKSRFFCIVCGVDYSPF